MSFGDDTREILKNIALVTELGLLMVSCIGISFAFGYFVLDEKTGQFPLWTIVFLLLGILAGFWSIYKRIMSKMK